jgi:tripartite-type tricarboxylate transporter receptor subunit TctC
MSAAAAFLESGEEATMKWARRKFLHLAACAAALPALSRRSCAQAYPTHPITIIVPNPPGGPTDVLARILAEHMRGPLGQPLIIENVGGAEGSIGTGRAARARPDGYTINIGGLSTTLNGAFYALSYDVLSDFAPLALLATAAGVVFARKTLPANDLNDLIAWLKANPNKASTGIGATISHLVAVLFQKATGTQFTLVPYRTANVAMQDLVAGQIDLVFTSSDRLALMQGGTVKALAVTSDTRLALAPEVPTFAEMGLPGLSVSLWYGVFAPKGTPADILRTLTRAAVDALADSVVRSRLNDLGFVVFPRERQTPEALAALTKAEAEKWWPIIKELGIRAE